MLKNKLFSLVYVSIFGLLLASCNETSDSPLAYSSQRYNPPPETPSILPKSFPLSAEFPTLESPAKMTGKLAHGQNEIYGKFEEKHGVPPAFMLKRLHSPGFYAKSFEKSIEFPKNSLSDLAKNEKSSVGYIHGGVLHPYTTGIDVQNRASIADANRQIQNIYSSLPGNTKQSISNKTIQLEVLKQYCRSNSIHLIETEGEVILKSAGQQIGRFLQRAGKGGAAVVITAGLMAAVEIYLQSQKVKKRHRVVPTHELKSIYGTR